MKIPVKQYWALLSQYLKAQKGRVLLLALLLLTHISLQLLNPQILRYFIDTAVGGGALARLINAALLFFGVAVLNQGLSIANTYLGEQVAWKATNALRLDLLLHLLRLDQSFHKAHTAGELLERIDGDVNALSNFFSRLIVYVLGNGLLVVGVLLLLWREEWRVGAALSFFAVLALAIMIRIRTVAVPHWAKLRQMSATFFGFLGEHLTGMEDIRANGATGYVMRRFDEIMQSWFPVRLRANMISSSLWTTNIALFAVANAIALGLSAYLWRNQAITIGTVYLIFYYTEQLRRPLIQLRNQIEDLQQAEASIGRIAELQAIQSKLPEADDGTLPRGALAVVFDNVSFLYDDETTVQPGVATSDGEKPPTQAMAALQEVSFQLAPGRVLGLLGRTGSGKTTLARLLLRLYDPGSGHIYLGGVAPASVPLRQMRQRVSMVTQDVQLFQASIRDNLTFFNPAISDERVTAVLDDLGLSGWLRTQPQDLDTEVAGGSGLSAGQAQLLAFARIFLADPGLVILDEASSRLDPATEQLIERAVDKLLYNRTGIIIAHHLATIQRADDILILENGRVLEYGERALLAQNPNSRLYHLLQTGLEEVLA